ncbi:hypothetical protein F383_22295 [Gossypium arboreum]|uniref:Uncharacterized protein n=1 Tax=Gossypium arboreum TaxID=29729 RepID=A0A0B0NYI1_GOSAR|nr:hypothetical protein F383_22295 [Gossypium arboreum]
MGFWVGVLGLYLFF